MTATIHAAPPVFGDLTPCCNLAVDQIIAGDWCTLDDTQVTCEGTKT